MINEFNTTLNLIKRILDDLIYLSNIKFFQTLTSALIGAFISISVFIGTQVWTSKREKKKQRESVLTVITQTHSKLFTAIYESSLDYNSVEYLKIREEYQRIGVFIYMVPNELKIHFNELYLIHYKDQSYYNANKHRIHGLCKSITEKINEYGVEVFGRKL